MHAPLWSCNSLADPISDLLSQVKKANERFGGEATDGPGRAGSGREDSRQLEKMYWIRGMVRPRDGYQSTCTCTLTVPGNKGRGGAGSNHSQKNTPGLHPFQFVAKAGWQAGRSAQGDPPTLPRLLDSISRP